MQYISGCLSLLIIMVLVNGLRVLMSKPVGAKSQTVILPKLILIIGIIGSAVFLIPAVIFLFSDSSDPSSVALSVFSLLGASLIVAYCNCRIIYDETTFTAKNFFGIKHTYTYNQITAIQGNKKDVKIYVGKRVVRIDELAVGKYEFLAFAKKQYRKLNNGQAIPTAKAKFDIFNGNVEQPGGFIFAYVLVTSLCIGMIVFLTINSAPKTADDLEHASLAFERYEIRDDDLMLYAKDDPVSYRILAYEELLSDASGFISLCNGRETFDVCYSINKYANTPCYNLESIVGTDGTVYLSLEAAHDYHWGNVWKVNLVFAGFAVLMLTLMAISIYVGRHPEKFSRRFIRLFFKGSYIRLPDEKRK